MFQQIMNHLHRFPQDGKIYVAIGKWGLAFSPNLSPKLEDFKKCVMLWDQEQKLLGICPIKDGKISGSFALGISDDGVGRKIAGNVWIREQVLPICESMKRNVFLLQKRTDVSGFEGSVVYMAELVAKAK